MAMLMRPKVWFNFQVLQIILWAIKMCYADKIHFFCHRQAFLFLFLYVYRKADWCKLPNNNKNIKVDKTQKTLFVEFALSWQKNLFPRYLCLLFNPFRRHHSRTKEYINLKQVSFCTDRLLLRWLAAIILPHFKFDTHFGKHGRCNSELQKKLRCFKMALFFGFIWFETARRSADFFYLLAKLLCETFQECFNPYEGLRFLLSHRMKSAKRWTLIQT